MANQIARRLRKTETIAEKRLWRELRKLRAMGYHFRRQHPVDDYIVDFACLAHLIVIEVDGYQHGEDAGLQKDAKRDAHLRWRGFEVVRFDNGDVRDHLDGVMLEILAKLGVVVKQE